MPASTENFCAQSISDCTGQIADIIQLTLKLLCSHTMRKMSKALLKVNIFSLSLSDPHTSVNKLFDE